MEEYFDLAIEKLRMQRHDFMNYFQVIMGYIQLNRTNDATNYMKEINQKMITLSGIYNLECAELSLLLQDLTDYLDKIDITVKFNCEIDYINHTVFSKNIYDKKKLFSDIKNRLENLSCIVKTKNMYIDLSGTPENFYIHFSNNEDAVKKPGKANEITYKSVYEKENEYRLSLYFDGKIFILKLNIF